MCAQPRWWLVLRRRQASCPAPTRRRLRPQRAAGLPGALHADDSNRRARKPRRLGSGQFRIILKQHTQVVQCACLAWPDIYPQCVRTVSNAHRNSPRFRKGMSLTQPLISNPEPLPHPLRVIGFIPLHPPLPHLFIQRRAPHSSGSQRRVPDHVRLLQRRNLSVSFA